MNSKTILAVSLAGVFAIAAAIASPVFASDSWLGVDTSNVAPKGAAFQLTIDATDAIPKNAGVGVLGGFGWFYGSGPDSVFAVTTHNPVRDSHQNPDHWHAHNVVAGGTISPGSGTDACIVSLSGYVQAGISIKGDKMKINVPATTLSGTLNQGAGAFHIVNNATACGVTILADGVTPSGLNLGVKFQ